MEDTDVVLGIGSNLGGRLFNVKSAINTLSTAFNVDVLKVSSFYETDPVTVNGAEGYVGEEFVNCCVLLKTKLEPNVVLGMCFGIEASLGRRRQYKSAPRTVDLDIIFYGDMVIENSFLKVPHLGTLERDFVLAPLGDICPDYRFMDIDFSKEYENIDWNAIRRLEEDF
ncbi:MAG: 2-amino-4-hydroxy-6-hydroxymethyldihydropteridine diphosphokinase [Oscillospiraceae bacterium]|jgi:2-amino-4-hydroxy-6-hydroxymethyldihydropteridine diphosphokinase|nr:2-amino-4-hydroxy-6-hydroxymethyldihydropteridine diphosphokinase [Oscillospiraceae bacterium]